MDLVTIAITLVQTGFVIYFARSNGKMREELAGCRFRELAATAFAQAIAERVVTIKCDDCGNMMGPDDNISVLVNSGRTYVGHSSHNRKADWGL